jgi:alkaline ceramidase TOD1/glycosyltransferase MUCI70-like protein
MHIFPKPVVYTCLFGDYEKLNEQPVALDSKIPFLCFTDRSDLNSKTWSARNIEPLAIDPARESKRVKILPHLFLKEFNESLYIDASCILKKTPETIFKDYLRRDARNFVSLRHPWRDCVYQAAEEVLRRDIDSEARVREQIDHYQKWHFPQHAGLIASGFLLRRHTKEDVKRSGEMWFSHVLRYSKRDQLSFSFTAWRTRLAFTALDLDLTSNQIFSWPNQVDRLPYHFDDQTYLWLNPDVAKAKMEPRRHFHLYGRVEGRPIRYHAPIELNRLANKFKSDKGDLYYHRHFYTRVYDHFLSPLKEEEITILEIGLPGHDIQATSPGGPLIQVPSLSMWCEYFSRAHVHGIDTQDFSNFEDDRVTITRADQLDRIALGKVVQRCRYPIKVVVDDGSHASKHQQISLAYLFPHLASGGFYFIEDLNDQPPHLEEPGTIKTRDLLRAILASKPSSSVFIEKSEIDYLAANIADIQFYDSMDYASGSIGQDSLAVIRKK